jgi:hypothetical protein
MASSVVLFGTRSPLTEIRAQAGAFAPEYGPERSDARLLVAAVAEEQRLGLLDLSFAQRRRAG